VYNFLKTVNGGEGGEEGVTAVPMRVGSRIINVEQCNELITEFNI
jgi:hypothetical protein